VFGVVRDVVVVGVLGAWFGVSVVQHVRGGRLLARFIDLDRYCLIPEWTFFAPVPFTRDFELLYRDRSPAGAVGRWCLVKAPTMHVWNVIWNPSMRAQKTRADLGGQLVRLMQSADTHEIENWRCYRALQSFVCGLPAQADGCSRQFMVLAVAGGYREGSKMQIMLVSPFRAL
jgi:hypothetical protein